MRVYGRFSRRIPLVKGFRQKAFMCLQVNRGNTVVSGNPEKCSSDSIQILA